jgi:hypothetical protein
MRLSDYDQHKMDEEYSAHMDAAEGERRGKAESDRIKDAAGAYIDRLLSYTSDPALSAKLLIGDRAFIISCMAGFACDEVIRAVKQIGGSDDD